MIYKVNNASLSMYADDHQLYIRRNSVQHSGDNFLKGNYNKCNVIYADKMNGRNNSDLSLNVNIDGHTIKSTPDLKLLRVT